MRFLLRISDTVVLTHGDLLGLALYTNGRRCSRGD